MANFRIFYQKPVLLAISKYISPKMVWTSDKSRSLILNIFLVYACVTTPRKYLISIFPSAC